MQQTTESATRPTRRATGRGSLMSVVLALGSLVAFLVGALAGDRLGGAILSRLIPPDLALDGGYLVSIVGELLGVVLFVRFVAHRSLASIGLSTWSPGRRWLSGALVGSLMINLVVIVWLTAIVGSHWSVNQNPGAAALGLAASGVFFLVQGPAEEILFRGAILTFIRERWGPWWGIGASSVLFGLVHAANPAFGVLPLVNLVLFGTAMACYVLFVDAGSIWGVFAIHSVWNWFEEFFYGLQNSGAVAPGGTTLFRLTPDQNGPAWLWGGGFGPEGTLGTTLLLLAVIVLCVRARARRRTPVPAAAMA